MSFGEAGANEKSRREKTNRKDGPKEAAWHENGREKKDVRQEKKLNKCPFRPASPHTLPYLRRA